MQRPTQRPVALRVIQFIQLRSISVQFIGEITTVWGTESNIGREGVREGGGGVKGEGSEMSRVRATRTGVNR